MGYLEFGTGQDPVLVEVGDQEITSAPGIVKAGVADRLKDGVARAQVSFGDALTKLIDMNAGAFVRAVQRLEEVPDQIEVEFSIKATGELGNLAIGKLSGDANYSVKLTWSNLSTHERDAAG
jgi:Trypsin-co-occurring domain 1